MKTTFYILLDSEGNVTTYNLPFQLDQSSDIFECLPVYAYIESYENLIDLIIEAYEFFYKGNQYLVDIVLRRENGDYRIILDDRTLVYKQKIIKQTDSNTEKIHAEYVKLNNDFLVSKNKYLDFLVTALNGMIADTNNRIKQSLGLLEDVNTYVEDDKQKINQVVDEIETEIRFLQHSIDHSKVLKHLNPSLILSEATYIDLNKLIGSIISNEDIEKQYLDIQIPSTAIIYGNENFYYELIKYYFKLIIHSKNKLILSSKQTEDDLMKIQINYFSHVKSLQLPQEFVQVFIVPTSHEIESNSKIIQKVYESLKHALLKQAYFLNQVAA